MLVANHGDSGHHKILGEKLLLSITGIMRTKMKVCCMKDCNEPVFKTISITKAIFSKRKQGAFVVKYPLCKDHNLRRDAIVDSKKFKKANPHIV